MSAVGSGPTPDGSVAKLIEIAEKPTLGRRLISWASRPPGRLYIPSCTVVALIILFEDSVPSGNLTAFVVGLVGGLLLAGMGALRLGIALAVARPMIRHYWLRWISAPLIAALAIGVSAADVPLSARVQASAEDLLALSDRADESSAIPLNGERAGLYSLRSLSVADGVLHYEVEGAGLVGRAGLAHSGETLPEGVFVSGQGTRIYEHVTDDWYVWVEH
ncbi:hypothetical protein [Nocardiopsis sp. CC223A]|uniref:hypothetical protein n=1 Tax=Nocardiopsis sp. CC223A TaxID=3044051 RepID=UPI00278C1BF8|nr:hypothetical protein [Nocardiopsis sp. CC223A]